MSQHPEFAAEQAFIDHAYDALDATRAAARRMRNLTETGRGGTFQAQFERDVITDQMRQRLSQLELGGAALVFGRIDTEADPEFGSETFHIGRLAVSDEHQEPLVVDWRAPVAEPFYRATGREPMGLARRRHFACDGRKLLDLEDELFGLDRFPDGSDDAPPRLSGYGTLLAALEQSRTGSLGDIVGTIQSEQDDVIRAELPGLLVVQGGPGTGKTVVALHRAAYLLYTYRFPLEGQGVLVVGPNRVFLRYIERVLPSLGEAGVELVTLGDLVPDALFGRVEPWEATRIKGSLTMAKAVRRAVADRERPLRSDFSIGFSIGTLRLRADQSAEIVRDARRRFAQHNPARRFIEHRVYEVLAQSSRDELAPTLVRERLHGSEEMRMLFESMWPVLTPTQLLHDLYGSMALLRSALRATGTPDEHLDAASEALFRKRTDDLSAVRWTDGDAPVLDEARALLGPRPAKRKPDPSPDEEIRTYGHIVIDEAQDLTPMQLRMVSRRSLNGSLTIVGDIAQATGPFAPDDWHDVIRMLQAKREPRQVELTLGYRIPAESMALASKVLRVAAPDLSPPRSVRTSGASPRFVRVAPGRLLAGLREAIETSLSQIGDGRIAVITPSAFLSELSVVAAEHEQVTVIAVGGVKGLEFDATVVVEPAAIVSGEPQGLRSLYVALTRATKRLTIVHEQPLPAALG